MSDHHRNETVLNANDLVSSVLERWRKGEQPNTAQVLDSHPYPYSLHRAHELAVVKQAEYEEIENLLLSKFPDGIEITGYRSNKDYLKGLK